MPALKGNRMGSNHTVRVGWCVGCGQTEGHRPDCTAHPAPLKCCEPGCSMVRMAGIKTPLWGYAPNRGYLCPEHKS